MQEITIKNIEKPSGESLNDALQWLGKSLGLFNQRDKENSCFRIFIELLKETKKGRALSSDELAARLNLVRGAVVHHLNRLMESGLVLVKNSRYSLKEKNLKDLVAGVKADADGILSNAEKVASRMDKSI